MQDNNPAITQCKITLMGRHAATRANESPHRSTHANPIVQVGLKMLKTFSKAIEKIAHVDYSASVKN